MSATAPTYQEVVDRLREEVLMESSTNRWTDAELLEMIRDEQETLAKVAGLYLELESQAYTSANAQAGTFTLSDMANEGQVLRNTVTMAGIRLREAPYAEVIEKQLRLPQTTAFADIYYAGDKFDSGAITVHFAPKMRNSGTITYLQSKGPRAELGGKVLANPFADHPDMNHGGFIQAVLYRTATRIYHAGGETERMNEAQSLGNMYITQWALSNLAPAQSQRVLSFLQGGGQQSNASR